MLQLSMLSPHVFFMYRVLQNPENIMTFAFYIRMKTIAKLKSEWKNLFDHN